MLLQKFARKKFIDLSAPSTLKRCLGTLDLTALGVGATLGVGTYVLAGSISKNEAGPAVILSMAIAAFASVFAGLCYAEFGTRVPKAGSAYVYGYVCVGELMGFILGWSMILSYGIGVSSVAKGYSGYVDSMVDGKMSAAFKKVLTMDVPLLADYIDFFSFGITALLSVILCFGMKESTKLNTAFTLLNISIILFVMIGGAWHVTIDNWSISVDDINNRTEYKNVCYCPDPEIVEDEEQELCEGEEANHFWCGNGGFAPYGVDGIIKGAASAFYGFVGFDVIATMGEEVINPQKMMPVAIILSLSIIFLAYFGLSAVVTLMLPYFLQDPNAPIPHIFSYVGWEWAAWIVRIGALMGLTASLLGGIVPLPRVIWAMASDGLLFQPLTYVHPKYQTPVVSTLVSGFLFAFIGAIFDLDVLVDFMSIGTLLAYTMVSACVIILRYKQTDEDVEFAKKNSLEILEVPFMQQIFNRKSQRVPTSSSANVAVVATLFIGIFSFVLCGVLANLRDRMTDGSGLAIFLIILVCVTGIILAILTISIFIQPQSVSYVAFKVPGVPFVPVISILLNVYLMASLDWLTWVKFGGWMAVGFIIYFGYGIWHSKASIDQSSRSRISSFSSSDNNSVAEMKP